MTHIILVRQDDGVLMGYAKENESDARTLFDRIRKMGVWGKKPVFQLFKAELIEEHNVQA